MSDPVRVRLRVTGLVQGVGFRPFAWRRATRLDLRGCVANDTGGVTIEVEGDPTAVAAFADGLADEAPPLARVVGVEAVAVPPRRDEHGFAIHESAVRVGAAAVVPADVATCAGCLAEVGDPANRRHRHAFATCSDCGPRYTIIEDLPYDRATTTMRAFAMCPRCAAEYGDPADRRFHAQPIGCHDCGPVPWFSPATAVALRRAEARVLGDDAIEAARRLLRAGGIVAIKGVGGFHLACDATSAAAVARLRERKHRPGKPLAVMVADVAAARAFAIVSEQERRILEGPERPIVLLRKRATEDGAAPLAAAVAPDNDFVGVLLPSLALHALLVADLPPLVMTSGNLAEEPIVHDEAEAPARLGGIADGFLMHDRRIHVACDDSVVRCVAGMPLPIRRARGHAPLPIPLASDGPAVLAVGGELKAAICVAAGDRAIMGQHVGDAASPATLEALARTADHLLRLFRVEPAAVAADLHPGFLTTAWARRFAAERGIPLITVQHHEAHVASLLAEHGLDAADGPFLVACCDGTGYGRDGTIQGGEFFHVEADRYRRVAHLAPFALPGGDAAIRQPWRAAVAVLHAAGLPWDERLPAVRAAGPSTLPLLATQLDRRVACVPTTSLGRLFDAVASLVGARHVITYEAEAALALEALAAAGDGAGGAYTFRVGAAAGESPARIDWRDVVAAVVADVVAGVAPATIAARFHAAVARLVADVAERWGSDARVVGLTGGVFQNALLVEQTVAALGATGREVLLHHRVPPNDGGLALGQAVLARRVEFPLLARRAC